MTDRVTIAKPDAVTILAARHLDEIEGPVQPGTVIRPADRAAITMVLCYIAKAHNASPDQSYANSAHELCGDGCDVTEAFDTTE